VVAEIDRGQDVGVGPMAVLPRGALISMASGGRTATVRVGFFLFTFLSILFFAFFYFLFLPRKVFRPDGDGSANWRHPQQALRRPAGHGLGR